MSFLSDPSALVLIVGALAIIGFLVHGLLLSDPPRNRRLKKNERKEQGNGTADAEPMVRIVSSEDKVRQDRTAAQNQAGSWQAQSGSSGQAQPQVQMSVSESQEAASGAQGIADNQMQAQAQPEATGAQSASEAAAAAAAAEQFRQKVPFIQLNLLAPEDHPFRGEELEAFFTQYRISRGKMDLFYVYENPDAPQRHEVFRIISARKPFSFPADMKGFSTPVLALYMNLPEQGKAYPYFRSMLVAANMLLEEVGGTVMQDTGHNIITQDWINSMAVSLQQYDALRRE